MLNSGGLRLFSRTIHVATPVAQAIVLHGYGDHSGRYEPLMRHLASDGIASIAPDLRGHGRSEGRKGFVRRWDEYLDDIRAVTATLDRALPTFVIGHSHGGLVALMAQQRGVLNANGLVLSSPFLRAALDIPVWKVAMARLANVVVPWLRISNGLNAEMMTADQEMVEASRQDTLLLRSATPRWYFQTLRTQRLAITNARAMSTPLLMLIGESDTVASPVANQQFFNDYPAADKSLAVFPNLRHELLRETSRVQIYEQIAQWILSHSPASAESSTKEFADHPGDA